MKAQHDRERGTVEVDVPNKRIARLLQLGIAAERQEKLRGVRRRMFKASRRQNRPYAGKRRSK